MPARTPVTWRSLAGLAVLLAAIWGGSQWIQSGRDLALAATILQSQPAGRITLYTSRTCIHCERAKAWLADARVPFRECLIEADPACADRYRRMGEPGTPVVQVDADQFHLGFDPDWLARTLTRRPAAESKAPDAQGPHDPGASPEAHRP